MADNQYLNIIIHNPINGAVEFPDNLTATYDETLTIPILTHPEKYFSSIIRFGIPIDLVPILIFPCNPLQNNANISNLIIGVQTGAGVQFPIPVTYVSSNNITAPTPNGTSPFFLNFQLNDPYYFVYSVQDMIDMFNTALAAAFVAAGSPGGGAAPYYIYTSTGQVISLIVTSAFIGSGAQIFMNAPLQVYLNSFRFKTKNNTNGPFMYYHNLATTPHGQTSPYQFDWEYNAIDLWLDARKIIITSQTLPSRQEASSTLTDAGNAVYQPIITDFLLSFNNIQDLSSIVVYSPTSQYRLIDLFKTEPISRFNFQFYWQSEAGALFPILLSPGQSITTKISFLNKSLYLHY